MAKYDKDTKFYWLQLKEDFFEEDAIEWLEEQENGHMYSLFYLKLCLISLNSNGVLIRKVGNMLVPYDAKKLASMTKMPKDTVIVAMELLKSIGLVQILESGEIYLTQIENLVGSASRSALKKQQQRALKKESLLLESGQGVDICPPLCPPKIEIENRDINKDIDIEKEKDKDIKRKKFTPPTLEEVQEYCKERNNNVDAKQFYDFYTAGDWIDSKGNKVKNWKQKVITWEKNATQTKPTKSNIDETMTDLDDLF